MCRHPSRNHWSLMRNSITGGGKLKFQQGLQRISSALSRKGGWFFFLQNIQCILLMDMTNQAALQSQVLIFSMISSSSYNKYGIFSFLEGCCFAAFPFRRYLHPHILLITGPVVKVDTQHLIYVYIKGSSKLQLQCHMCR